MGRTSPSLAWVRYDADARLDLGERPTPVGEDALAGYLRQARQLLATGPGRPDDRPSRFPADLEALRDFHLPACLPDGERPRGSFFIAATPHRGS